MKYGGILWWLGWTVFFVIAIALVVYSWSWIIL